MKNIQAKNANYSIARKCEEKEEVYVYMRAFFSYVLLRFSALAGGLNFNGFFVSTCSLITTICVVQQLRIVWCFFEGVYSLESQILKIAHIRKVCAKETLL